MKIKFVLFFLILFLTKVNAQVEDHAWVYFTGKPSEATYMAAPLTMLTQRALDRRTRYNIPIDFKDVPVEASYIAAVENENGITVKAISKWLNAVHIKGLKTDIDALLLSDLKVNDISIIDYIEFADKTLTGNKNPNSISKPKQPYDKLKVTTTFNYGQAANQIQMLKGEVLHQNNFTGEGMVIAVLDAGFPNVNSLSAFNYIRTNTSKSQILGGYNYVGRSDDFYTGGTHGTTVLSTIAGYVYSDDGVATNDFIGTAPDASFYLFITEDDATETPLEESLWVEAAEEADRLGVDVINTSLGYSSFFDEDRYNYPYSAMDGKTTFITRGAEIAFSRGMILVNSAGNEGNDPWKYINAPADGPSVLTIGAVNASGVIASFSSYGPTSDGRVKPDVCAEGAGVYVINASGTIATSNGTSFSGPIMAGMVACLWQAFPDKTNAEITESVRKSAHLYPGYTDQEGYGIPNFETVYNTLAVDDEVFITNKIKLYPNPSAETIYFSVPNSTLNFDVLVYSAIGKLMLSKSVNSSDPKIDISNLPTGIYFVRITSNLEEQVLKIVKQ